MRMRLPVFPLWELEQKQISQIVFKDLLTSQVLYIQLKAVNTISRLKEMKNPRKIVTIIIYMW